MLRYLNMTMQMKMKKNMNEQMFMNIFEIDVVDTEIGADEDPDVHVDVHEKGTLKEKPWMSVKIMREL